MKSIDKGALVETVDDNLRGRVLAVEGNSVRVLTDDGFELVLAKEELVLLPSESVMQVSNAEVSRAFREKTQGEKQKRRSVKREKTDPPMEVDLHVEKLTRDMRGLTSHDMLTLQVDTAKRQLEFAIARRIRRVVFIHGVGEGVLRTELEYLFGRYPGISWYDADYQRYGLGATEVYIPQNA